MKKLVVVAIALTVLFAAVPAHGAIRGRMNSATGTKCGPNRCWEPPQYPRYGNVRVTVHGAFECYPSQEEIEAQEKEIEDFERIKPVAAGRCSNEHNGGYESGVIVVHPRSTAGECVVGGYDRQKAAHPLYWLAGIGIFHKEHATSNVTLPFTVHANINLHQRQGAVACLEIETDEGIEVPEEECLPEFKPSVREELCATEVLGSHSKEVVAVAKIRWHARTAGAGKSRPKRWDRERR